MGGTGWGLGGTEKGLEGSGRDWGTGVLRGGGLMGGSGVNGVLLGRGATGEGVRWG